MDKNEQEIIDKYEEKLTQYNNLRDDISNLQKSISTLRENIKSVLSSQETLKTANYNVWAQLENKDSINSKTTTEQKEPSISDIIGGIKL